AGLGGPPGESNHPPPAANGQPARPRTTTSKIDAISLHGGTWRRTCSRFPPKGGRMATRRKRTASRRRRSSRRYGPKASKKVERSMHEMKHGQLRSGRSAKKGRSGKQGIAVGLPEARRAGGKVPSRRSSARSRSRAKH